MCQECGSPQPLHLINRKFIGPNGSEIQELTIEHLHLCHANGTKYMFGLAFRRGRVVFGRFTDRSFSMQGPGSS